ncbi:hypothetical protein N6H05_09385 [Sphingobium sp. WTD-1]|uniref:hypothetical protein n=1 Tax=Sphingobium sp. WTD-1 TaxID=2979467 RepID=UPI0024DE9673|nr:hypothetical protein [Sphingobium sp. WTD-1]WIA57982.1 hypothetical protein N6H05_09385 [Sphingobium sp. WTD-1]
MRKRSFGNNRPLAVITVQLQSPPMAVLCSKLRYWAAQITALLFAALALIFTIRSLAEERDGAATYGATGWIQTIALVSIPIVIWWTRGKRVAPYIQAMQIVFILSVILWLASLPQHS